MSLSTNRIVWGIHSLATYTKSNGLPHGILKVLGGGTLALSAEFEDLFGGSNLYAWASEVKSISSEFTATVKSMPDFLFEQFLGASVSTTAASTTGTVSALENVFNDTVFDATTGIASASFKVGEEANLKSGVWLIKAKTADTVTVYNLTDIDFSRGTDIAYLDDDLIVEDDVTITSATAVDIANTGIELTGGSGAIAMTIGDTCKFYSAKPHGGVSEITLGETGASFSEIGALALTKKRANGDLFEVEMFSLVGGGFPIPMEEGTFAIPEMTAKLLYDVDKNAIAKIRAIKGV